jgi:glycosyltransferase involved in cell wall biosynthesis
VARILIVYKHLPAPGVGHAGGETLFTLMEALVRRGHRLILVARVTEAERRLVAVVRPVCEAVYTVRHHGSLPGPRSLAVLRSYLDLRRTARRAVQAHRPDLIHVETTQTAVTLLAIRRPPGSVHTHDLAWLLMAQRAAHEHGLRRLLLRALAWAARRVEPWLYQRYEVVLTLSGGDRRRLAARCHRRQILVLPLTPGIVPREVEPAIPPGPNLLFVGAMGRTFNVQAVQWFLEDVWPLILREVPDARLVIAGSQPPAWLRARHDGARVIVTGFVDDLLPWYRSAAVFVCPLLVAGGLLQKVVDALGLGVPVVATSVSNLGLEAVPGEHLLVADEAPAFARAVVGLLRDPLARARVGQAGQRFVREHCDLDRAVDGWEGALLGLLGHGAPSDGMVPGVNRGGTPR